MGSGAVAAHNAVHVAAVLLRAGAFLAWGLAPAYVVERVDRESAVAAVRAQQHAIKHWAYDLLALLGRGGKAGAGAERLEPGVASAVAAAGGGGGKAEEADDPGLATSGTDMLHLRDTVPRSQRVLVVVAMALAVVAVRYGR